MQQFHYCKPVAKVGGCLLLLPPCLTTPKHQSHPINPFIQTPNDRLALLNALVTSTGKFFLGTDSAPHDISAKKGKGNTAAGVFTQPYAVAYVFTALEEAIARGDVKEEQVTQELFEGFLGGFGRKFYGVEASTERIVVEKKSEVVVDSINGDGGIEVVPFRKGRDTWSVNWV